MAKVQLTRWRTCARQLYLSCACGLLLSQCAWQTTKQIRSGVVKVMTSHETGSGFFVSAGSEDAVYVATAYHLVANDAAPLIESEVEVSKDERYVIAYPDTELVAFDADADLAILRVKHLPTSRITRLSLAAEAVRGESISSHGFPGTNLTRRAGLISIEGKVLSKVKFPVHDYRYRTTVQENAVDGILISSNIEPGFSGGPTCNTRGEVVGVNVTKDLEHTGQNGAVDVSVLKRLLGEIPKAQGRSAPSRAEVNTLLQQLQSTLLMLPFDQRLRRRESEFVSPQEYTRLRTFATDLRSLQRQATSSDPGALSPQASLGIAVAGLAGRPLETFMTEAIQQMLADCEKRQQQLLLKQPQSRAVASASGSTFDGCGELAIRPLAWDLVAAALRWEGMERKMEAVEIQQVDRELPTYKVGIKMDGVANLHELWVSRDAGRLYLRLFDSRGGWYALFADAAVDPAALAGSWHARRATTLGNDPGGRAFFEEMLDIWVGGQNGAAIHHRHRTLYQGSRPFTCSGRTDAETVVEQEFKGTLVNGAIRAEPRTKMAVAGRDPMCPTYSEDKAVVVKLLGDRLYMYRTEGLRYPEVVAFERR